MALRRRSDFELSAAVDPSPTEVGGQLGEAALGGTLLLLAKPVEVDRGADHRCVRHGFDDVDDFETGL